MSRIRSALPPLADINIQEWQEGTKKYHITRNLTTIIVI
jgi:hypothetical protein